MIAYLPNVTLSSGAQFQFGTSSNVAGTPPTTSVIAFEANSICFDGYFGTQLTAFDYGASITLICDGINWHIFSMTGEWALDGMALSKQMLVANPIAGIIRADFDNGKIFTNEGSAVLAVMSLPAPYAGLYYDFYVENINGIQIQALAGHTIRIGTSVSTAGGTATNSAIGSSVRLIAINATQWVAVFFAGTWTLA